MADFQPSNTIVNGYFYSFTYNPPSMSKGYDRTPLVFVLGPSLKSLNNFVGINLHHLAPQQREYFIRNLQRIYNFMNTPRTIVGENEITSILNGITIAKREYNRKFVSNCIRIPSQKVPLYIYGDGHVSQQEPNQTTIKWLEQRGLYQSKESKK